MTSNEGMKPNRVGLSEYTARRLAELRARRAEADDTGGISIGASSSSSSTAAAETTANDSDSSSVPPIATTQPTTTQMAYSRSAAGTTAHDSPAFQLPTSNDLSSSSHLPKTASPSVSAPTAAVSVSNGVSGGLLDTANVPVRNKQLWSDKSESDASAEQRRIDRQDIKNNVRAAAVEPSKLPVQRREVPQPSPFARTGFHSNDATSSGSAVEVGALNKMVRFTAVPFYTRICNEHFVLFDVTCYFALR